MVRLCTGAQTDSQELATVLPAVTKFLAAPTLTRHQPPAKQQHGATIDAAARSAADRCPSEPADTESASFPDSANCNSMEGSSPKQSTAPNRSTSGTEADAASTTAGSAAAGSSGGLPASADQSSARQSEHTRNSTAESAHLDPIALQLEALRCLLLLLPACLNQVCHHSAFMPLPLRSV